MIRIMTALLAYHRTAMATAVDLVNEVERFDLPTPCAGWDLDRLLAHMTAQNLGFAAAARGDAFELRTWQEVPATPQAFADSAEAVVAAFGSDKALSRDWSLLAGADQELKVPGGTALGFHFIDYVVHSWDVGVSIGKRPVFSEELLTAVETLAFEVPLTGPARTGPYAPFAPAVMAVADAGAMDRVLAVLGRDPNWRSPQG
ncbi:TIGR03086 family protein [Glycomyces sambucus]|uniref:TIGR03086 family protein n=2 Tax=Glycomyces sambucus TaxID=380244 RepID=A0A1G9MWE4_9ACTN|nr:TIGR03086 family protein [Glycomyces sambucus]